MPGLPRSLVVLSLLALHGSPMAPASPAAPMARSSDELPVAAWRERTSEVESLDLDYEVTSKDGMVLSIRFVFQAPNRAYAEVRRDGELDTRFWAAGPRFTTLRFGEKAGHAALDYEAVTAPATAWTRAVTERFPRERGGDLDGRADPPFGPLLSLWPLPGPDVVDIGVSVSRASLPLAWIGRLARLDPDARRIAVAPSDGTEAPRDVEPDWEVAVAPGARLRLEPRFGILREIRMGAPERLALRLVKLEVDGALDPALLEPPARPEGGEDLTGAVARAAIEENWRLVRVWAYRWLARCADEGLELDGNTDAIEEEFGAYCAARMGDLEAALEFEKGVVDSQLDKLEEWYRESREREGIDAALEKQLIRARASLQERWRQLEGRLVGPDEAPEVESVEQEVARTIRGLERKGAARWVERALVGPLRDHWAARLEALGVKLPEPGEGGGIEARGAASTLRACNPS